MLKIATWNVNSINARLPTALAVIKTIGADILALQEIKCEDSKFPREAIEELGYNVVTHGQKSYNGVALLSKHPFEEVYRGLNGVVPSAGVPSAGVPSPGVPSLGVPSLGAPESGAQGADADGASAEVQGGAPESDEQARYLEAVIAAPQGPFRVGAVYAPNGNPIGTDKFAYKVRWMERLIARACALLESEERFALIGDYNIIPRDEDADDPLAWSGDALFSPEAKRAYRRLINLGLVDAFMCADARAGQYTFWDYQAGAWRKNHGIRIDHLLVSPQAADRLRQVEIYKEARALEKASDHVPVIASFDA